MNNGRPAGVSRTPGLHLQRAYREYGDGDGACPVAESLAWRILSLPMHAYLDAATVERIADVVKRAA